MYCSSISLKRVRLFDLPPKVSNTPQKHYYHNHDLLEWFVDNKIEFLTILLDHWKVEVPEDSSVIATFSLVLYGTVREGNDSFTLRNIRRSSLNSISRVIGPNTWKYDNIRSNSLNERHIPNFPLGVVPDYHISINKQADKMEILYVHPCRYMNWIQFIDESDNRYKWRFSPKSETDSHSNYYDCKRSELDGTGINGQYSPLISYGNLTEWIVYSIEELEESVPRNKLPLSYSSEPFYEPHEYVIRELGDFLSKLQGSIYQSYVSTLQEICKRNSLILSSITFCPNISHIKILNRLSNKLYDGGNVDESIMTQFEEEYFTDMKSFTNHPEFHSLQSPLVEIYRKTLRGFFCCADFAEIVLTTTQTYSDVFELEIEYRDRKNQRAHIDFHGRIGL